MSATIEEHEVDVRREPAVPGTVVAVLVTSMDDAARVVDAYSAEGNHGRTRYYEPVLGRFVSRDPLSYIDGLSLYCGYFVPDGLDPTGLAEGGSPTPPPPPPSPAPIPIIKPQPLTPELVRQLIEQDERARGYFRPGPYAGNGIPIGRDRPYASQSLLDLLQSEGDELGCHTCGAPDSGTPTGKWICDHQEAKAINPKGTDYRGYPQCKTCSATQGGYLRGVLTRAGNVADFFGRVLGCCANGLLLNPALDPENMTPGPPPRSHEL